MHKGAGTFTARRHLAHILLVPFFFSVLRNLRANTRMPGCLSMMITIIKDVIQT